MAKQTNIYALAAVNNIDGAIANADGTSKKTIFTAGSNDSIIRSFNITSTDTSARIVLLYVNVGGSGTDRCIGAVNVPALSGTDGATAAVDALRTTLMTFFEADAFGNCVCYLKAGSLLKAALSASAVTSGKTIDMFGSGGDF